MSAHVSFLAHERFRWFKRSAWLCLITIVVYSAYAPVGGRNGGTWVGYGLGGLGLLLILWLAWLGVKKRGFSSGAYTIRGWTSAHVYLGLSLIVVATLHTGFEFGWNVHTLAYALMMAVIISGGFGVFAYLRYPRVMSENMSGRSAAALRQEMAELDVRIARLTQRLPDKFAEAARISLEGTRIGGGFFQLLGGSSKRCGSARAREMARAEAEALEETEQQATATEMVSALSRKAEIAQRLRRDLSYKAVMDVWLWIHVPLTLGLIATLAAHVLIVFFYW
ncbi:hypothetical protein G5B40_04615 [Pikeienuella piscinae]|uniref:Ferric reductase like transmembrane component n=1 Tax=Pikeienuella piscinae TaxID=2748098 RepID=A0A7L5BVF4_9RHOB|nr:hypothetical protein [Pikeienuella piscinae]QIE54788.1 hypothetical protein G5B40_04615 [Pikeienuella piscinae]